MKPRHLLRALVVMLLIGGALPAVPDAAAQATPTTNAAAPGVDLGPTPPGIQLTVLAGGPIAALPAAPAGFAIQRVTVAPNGTQSVRGAGQDSVVVYVENDGLTFVDASGLEAPTVAGTQIVLPPGIQYTARNGSPLPASFLRMSLAGGAPALTETPPAQSSAAETISLDLQDIQFNPETLTIPADTNVLLHLTNSGATIHNFNIDALNVHSGDLQPGESADVVINASGGTYSFYCSVPGHRAAGMAGTLTVTGEPGAASSPPDATTMNVVDLGLEDIKFSTDAVTIPANTDVTIHITNTGVTDHDFSIDELKISTGPVAPGASVDVTINAPAGTYTYYCNIPGHKAAGMKGTLTVEASKSAPNAAEAPSSGSTTLLQAKADQLPHGPVMAFLARATFAPGATTGQLALAAPLGLVAEQGALTVARANLLPAVLPQGKSALLGQGTQVELSNVGQKPTTVLMGGFVLAGGNLFGSPEATSTATAIVAAPPSGHAAATAAPATPSSQSATLPNQWSIAVTSVRSLSAINSYETVKARGTFVVVDLTVTNLSDNPVEFPYDDLRLIDAKKRTFEANSMADIVLAINAGLSIYDNLQPGLSYPLTVVFDVPTDAANLTLTSSRSAFSIALPAPVPSPDITLK